MKSNEDHLQLRSVTKLTICSDTEFYDFGLHLGYTFSQMKQKRTNHPHSIENAALEAVTEWWDSCIEPHSEKVKIIANCVEKIGKANLASSVKEKLLREPPDEQHADSSQTNGNNSNDERELNGNDGSEIQQRPEPSNGQHGNSTQTDSNDNTDERDLNGNNWSEISEQWSAERNEEGDQTVIKQVDGSFQNGHNFKELSAHAPFVPTIKRKFNEENTFKTKSKYGRLSECSEGETM